jgi:hypothetical protein
MKTKFYFLVVAFLGIFLVELKANATLLTCEFESGDHAPVDNIQGTLLFVRFGDPISCYSSSEEKYYVTIEGVGFGLEVRGNGYFTIETLAFKPEGTYYPLHATIAGLIHIDGGVGLFKKSLFFLQPMVIAGIGAPSIGAAVTINKVTIEKVQPQPPEYDPAKDGARGK